MNTGRWDDVCRELDNVSFQRLGALRGYEDTAKKELVQSLRKSAQNIIKQLDEDLFCVDEAGFLEDIRFLRPRIETLFDLVLDYDRRLMQEKRERRLLDFSDLEHFAVQLLVKEEKGKREKTALAKELSEQFAFVLVDEYQDTNATQDMIFQSVSRPDNLFMVGDVKQSIYRFRQAMPEIFIEKRNTFHDYDGQHYPARIVLSHKWARSITMGPRRSPPPQSIRKRKMPSLRCTCCKTPARSSPTSWWRPPMWPNRLRGCSMRDLP